MDGWMDILFLYYYYVILQMLLLFLIHSDAVIFKFPNSGTNKGEKVFFSDFWGRKKICKKNSEFKHFSNGPKTLSKLIPVETEVSKISSTLFTQYELRFINFDCVCHKNGNSHHRWASTGCSCCHNGPVIQLIVLGEKKGLRRLAARKELLITPLYKK